MDKVILHNSIRGLQKAPFELVMLQLYIFLILTPPLGGGEKEWSGGKNGEGENGKKREKGENRGKGEKRGKGERKDSFLSPFPP